MYFNKFSLFSCFLSWLHIDPAFAYICLFLPASLSPSIPDPCVCPYVSFSSPAFKVKVTARAHMIKIWQFLLHPLNCEFFYDQTLLVHYYKSECCVQGQGHSKISKIQWIFVQMISSESLSLLQPNLVLVTHHHEPDCLPKKWVCCLEGQGHTVKDHIIKIWLYLPNCWSICN